MKNNKFLKLAFEELNKDDGEDKAYKLFLEVAENVNLSDIIRSDAYRAAGEVIYIYAPYLGKADAGYSLFKKAMELDKDNLQAKIYICDLFFDPEGQFEVKEKEFLENMMYLLNSNIGTIDDKYDKEEIENMEYNLNGNIKLYFKQKLEGMDEN